MRKGSTRELSATPYRRLSHFRLDQPPESKPPRWDPYREGKSKAQAKRMGFRTPAVAGTRYLRSFRRMESSCPLVAYLDCKEPMAERRDSRKLVKAVGDGADDLVVAEERRMATRRMVGRLAAAASRRSRILRAVVGIRTLDFGNGI
uniref:Uncharacterized protein n=1 Tax=Cannabis sativa TaxID=3483 RepID=A0A803P760_CANSA